MHNACALAQIAHKTYVIVKAYVIVSISILVEINCFYSGVQTFALRPYAKLYFCMFFVALLYARIQASVKRSKFLFCLFFETQSLKIDSRFLLLKTWLFLTLKADVFLLKTAFKTLSFTASIILLIFMAYGLTLY